MRALVSEIKVLGLTGQTGAGKTTVSDWIRQTGIPVIDADLVARQVVAAGRPCLRELTQEFSSGILLEDGSLNRRMLGQLVFSDSTKLAALNRITFPYILAEISLEIQEFRQAGKRLAVLDAPTLFESGADSLCAWTACVVAPEQLRLARIMARDSLSRQQAQTRIWAQNPQEFYTSRCRFVLENTGELLDLQRQVQAMLAWLQEHSESRASQERRG